jgi:hypothetical protein
MNGKIIVIILLVSLVLKFVTISCRIMEKDMMSAIINKEINYYHEMSHLPLYAVYYQSIYCHED